MFFFKLKIVLTIIICILCEISIQFNNNFCDSQHKNSLIDSVFSTDTTVYAIRKSSDFVSYIYALEKYRGLWVQTYEAESIHKLFKGSDPILNTIQSGFVINPNPITDCKNCNLTEKSFNITYIFSDDKFYVFRAINSDKLRNFIFLKTDDSSIPWKRDKNSYGLNFGNISDYFGLNHKINAAFFEWKTQPNKAFAYLLAKNGSILRTEITYILDSNRTKPSLESILIMNNLSPNSFRGSFVRDVYVFFVVNNDIYNYVIGQQKPIAIVNKTSVWDYFNCEDSQILHNISTNEQNSTQTISSVKESQTYSDNIPTETSDSGTSYSIGKTNYSMITTNESETSNPELNETETKNFAEHIHSAKTKSLIFIIAIVFVVILVVVALIVYFYLTRKSADSESISDLQNLRSKQKPIAEEAKKLDSVQPLA